MRGQGDFWRRFAVLAMLEAIGRVPVLGPLAKSAYHAYEETRPQLDLLGEALKTLQAMARDLAALLEAEGEKDLHRLDLALSTAIEALRRNGLTPQELAEHNLDPDRAAAETLRRSSELLRDLDETTQALSKRLVREYYRTLMEHPRVNEALAVPALAEGLQRLEELERRLDDLMALPRRRAWAALKPAAEKARLPDSPGLSVAILKAPYHFIPYTGRAYKSLRDELASWATQLEKFPYRTGVRIIYGPGGSGKTRLAVETARVLFGQGLERLLHSRRIGCRPPAGLRPCLGFRFGAAAPHLGLRGAPLSGSPQSRPAGPSPQAQKPRRTPAPGHIAPYAPVPKGRPGGQGNPGESGRALCGRNGFLG